MKCEVCKKRNGTYDVPNDVIICDRCWTNRSDEMNEKEMSPEWHYCEYCNLYASTNFLAKIDGQWVCQNEDACKCRVRDRQKEEAPA